MQGNAHDEEHLDEHGECRHEIERLRRLLQWCEVRLPEQYRAGLRRMIENPAEPDHTPIIQS